MKAKELAELLMKNPDAIVCVWDDDPNCTWVEVTVAALQKDVRVDADDGYQTKSKKVDSAIMLGFNR